MICVSDTNILSSFLGIGRLDLLLATLGADHVLIPGSPGRRLAGRNRDSTQDEVVEEVHPDVTEHVAKVSAIDKRAGHR